MLGSLACNFCDKMVGNDNGIQCKSCETLFHIHHLMEWLVYREGCPDCLSKEGFILDELHAIAVSN